MIRDTGGGGEGVSIVVGGVPRISLLVIPPGSTEVTSVPRSVLDSGGYSCRFLLVDEKGFRVSSGGRGVGDVRVTCRYERRLRRQSGSIFVRLFTPHPPGVGRYDCSSVRVSTLSTSPSSVSLVRVRLRASECLCGSPPSLVGVLHLPVFVPDSGRLSLGSVPGFEGRGVPSEVHPRNPSTHWVQVSIGSIPWTKDRTFYP